LDDSSSSGARWLTAPRPIALASPAGVRTALHQAALLGLPWCEQLAVAQNQHWQRVGLLRKTIWKYGANALARSLKAHELTVSSLSWAGGFTGSVGFSFREAVADSRQAVEEAESVNAETLVIAPGSRAGHTFRHSRRMVVDGLKFLVDAATERELRLAVLVSPPAKHAAWSYLTSDDDALELIEEIGSPLVGLACPLPKTDGHPSLLERWQRISKRAWVVWSDADGDMRAPSLNDLLRKLSRSGFTGIWELRSQSPAADVNTRGQRELCRAVSEALGLPPATRPSSVMI